MLKEENVLTGIVGCKSLRKNASAHTINIIVHSITKVFINLNEAEVKLSLLNAFIKIFPSPGP